MESKILVGARASRLSRVQVQEVHEELKQFHPGIEFSPIWISTTGDQDLVTSLRTLDKTDFFTREVDQLLLEGKCQIAIHSAKDLPEPLPAGLKLIALTRGVDPADSLVLPPGERIETLPRNARIGTSSLRREEKIRELRADFISTDIRGTIERRLSLLEEKKVEGLIIAEAALIRLGLTHLNRIKLTGETAPLQGQLAVVARADAHALGKLFVPLDVRNAEVRMQSAEVKK